MIIQVLDELKCKHPLISEAEAVKKELFCNNLSSIIDSLSSLMVSTKTTDKGKSELKEDLTQLLVKSIN